MRTVVALLTVLILGCPSDWRDNKANAGPFRRIIAKVIHRHRDASQRAAVGCFGHAANEQPIVDEFAPSGSWDMVTGIFTSTDRSGVERQVDRWKLPDGTLMLLPEEPTGFDTSNKLPLDGITYDFTETRRADPPAVWSGSAFPIEQRTLFDAFVDGKEMPLNPRIKPVIDRENVKRYDPRTGRWSARHNHGDGWNWLTPVEPPAWRVAASKAPQGTEK